MKKIDNNIEKHNKKQRINYLENELKKIQNLTIVLIFILCITLTYMLFIFFYEKNQTQINKKDNFGILPGMSSKEIQNILNEVSQQSMINVSINPEPIFQNGKSKGNIRIENVLTNNHNFVVTIKLSDNKTVLYKSKLIPPGHYIENIKLLKNLKKGTYPATVFFDAYLPNSDNIETTIKAEILIHILN